jgi:proteic killer suppression protein
MKGVFGLLIHWIGYARVASCKDTRYNQKMIVGFRHKGLEAFFRTGSAKGVQVAHTKKLRIILAALDVASELRDLDLPAFKLHSLKHDLKGHWSIWVNGNWRVTFRFIESNVELVDYQDYH